MQSSRRWGLWAAAGVSLLLCLFVVGCGAPIRAQLQDAPTPVIPGMPSCYCPPPDSVTPAAQDTAIPVATPPGVSPHKIVAIDPGHGGKETGAASANGLIEKNVNLKIALKLAALLRAGGYGVVLTRDSDRGVDMSGKDLNGDGVVDVNDDLQARVDVANAAQADILLSIHNDSRVDPSVGGTTVYYCDVRSFAAASIRLAGDLQRHLVGAIRRLGYDDPDRGISDDAPLKKPYGHLEVLGPRNPRTARPSNMPGALGESLFLSNPTEAALLAKESTLDAIAEGYYEGIQAYFAGQS